MVSERAVKDLMSEKTIVSSRFSPASIEVRALRAIRSSMISWGTNFEKTLRISRSIVATCLKSMALWMMTPASEAKDEMLSTVDSEK